MSCPVWIPPALNEAFKNIVIQAYTKPHIYHPQYVPLPWCVGFYGRPGMEKATVMQRLCMQYGLSNSYTLFTLKIGECNKVLNEIECVAKATSSVLASIEDESEKLGPKHIILVDEADILCYEPDSEQALLKSADLAKLCETNHVLLIGIFNRFPGEGTNVSPWIREVQNKFCAQFKALLYIEAPNASFRISLFKFYIESFVQHFNSVQEERNIKVNLNEDDYERLADFSTFAAPENILVFMRKVFLNITNNPEIKEITADYMEDFTSKRYGSPHICDYDAREVDNAFATACGFGPAVKPKKQTILKGENLTNVTGFTEDNVDLEHVMKTLGEQKDLESPSKKIKTDENL